MSGGSRDDVGRFTVSCTSIQFLCLIFLVSCPIFVDKCTSPQIAAPAVAAPEPTQGQQESDLVSNKRKRTNKGKRALMIDSGGSAGSGGTTGTGLNL